MSLLSSELNTDTVEQVSANDAAPPEGSQEMVVESEGVDWLEYYHNALLDELRSKLTKEYKAVQAAQKRLDEIKAQDVQLTSEQEALANDREALLGQAAESSNAVELAKQAGAKQNEFVALEEVRVRLQPRLEEARGAVQAAREHLTGASKTLLQEFYAAEAEKVTVVAEALASRCEGFATAIQKVVNEELRPRQLIAKKRWMNFDLVSLRHFV